MPNKRHSNRGSTGPQNGRKDPNSVPILINAFRVFRMLSQSPGGETKKSVALSLGIPPTTCYRILRSFVSENWLRIGDDGRYAVSFGLVPLLRPLLRHELLVEHSRAPLHDLAHKTGLTAKLSVRQGADAVTIHGEYPARDRAIVSRVGSAVSIAIGSSGAVFLANMPDKQFSDILLKASPETWRFQEREDVLRRVRQAKQDGYCFDSGSYQPDVNTLSAPVFGHDNELVGVITLLGLSSDFSPDLRLQHVRALKYTAGGFSRLIAGHVLDAAF